MHEDDIRYLFQDLPGVHAYATHKLLDGIERALHHLRYGRVGDAEDALLITLDAYQSLVRAVRDRPRATEEGA